MKKKALLFLLVFLLTSLSAIAQVRLLPPSNGTVWYFIEVDRFKDGDITNNPNVNGTPAISEWKLHSWTSDWFSRMDWEKAMHPEFSYGATMRLYGGDFQGIKSKLDYLKSLGISVIVLSQVFEHENKNPLAIQSLHHVHRFYGPDPGTDGITVAMEDALEAGSWRWTEADKTLADLLKAAHARNIKVVLTLQLHFVSNQFWAFKDVRSFQQKSPYREWFDVRVFDDPKTTGDEFLVEGFSGNRALPLIKRTKTAISPPFQEYLMQCLQRWMDPDGDGDPSDGVDGWFLRYTEEIPIPFWKDFHNSVRRLNEDALTLTDAGPEKIKFLMNSGGFSTATNTVWMENLDAFFTTGSITADQFIERQREVLGQQPAEANFKLVNMLDASHTPRLSSRIKNRASFSDAMWKEGRSDVGKPEKDEVSLTKLASFFQFTSVGTPGIYYGNENGMWGGDDPDQKKPMLWPELTYLPEQTHPRNLFRKPDSVKADVDMTSWYRQLIKMRARHEELQRGSIYFLSPSASDRTLAFIRTIDQTELVLVVINTDSKRPVTIELPRTLAIAQMETYFGRASLNRRRNHVVLPPLSSDLLYLVRKP